jgi:hypothetical protein
MEEIFDKNKTDDSDIDYEKVLDNLNSEVSGIKPQNQKQSININKFVKSLESDLKNLKSDINDIKLKDNSIKSKESYSYELFNPKLIYQKHREIFIYMLLFILINTNLIVELINNRTPDKFNNSYINLLTRTIIFGIFLYVIKKYKLL